MPGKIIPFSKRTAFRFASAFFKKNVTSNAANTGDKPNVREVLEWAKARSWLQDNRHRSLPTEPLERIEDWKRVSREIESLSERLPENPLSGQEKKMKDAVGEDGWEALGNLISHSIQWSSQADGIDGAQTAPDTSDVEWLERPKMGFEPEKIPLALIRTYLAFADFRHSNRSLEDPWQEFVEVAPALIRELNTPPPHEMLPNGLDDAFRLGSRPLPFYIRDGDGERAYAQENVWFKYEDERVQLSPSAEARKKQIDAHQEHVEEEQGTRDIWAGPKYWIKDFSTSRTPQEEEMILHVTLGKSDYYDFQATMVQLDHQPPQATESFRSRHLLGTVAANYLPGESEDVSATDFYRSRPHPFLALSPGVSLLVRTADGQFVFTKRSEGGVGVRSGGYDVSVVEGMLPGDDGPGPKGEGPDEPDPYRTAVRGCKQELGVDIDKDDVDFLAFGVDAEFYQWNLLGTVQLDITLENLLERRSRGSHEKWEVEKLHPYAANSADDIEEVFRFLSGVDIWATGKVTTYLSSVHHLGKDTVDQALSGLEDGVL